MTSLTQGLAAQLSGAPVQQIAQQLGVSPSQAQGAIATDEMKASAKAKADERAAAIRNEPKVDINNASKAEIARVLQISSADAGRIIAARPIRARTSNNTACNHKSQADDTQNNF